MSVPSVSLHAAPLIGQSQGKTTIFDKVGELAKKVFGQIKDLALAISKPFIWAFKSVVWVAGFVTTVAAVITIIASLAIAILGLRICSSVSEPSQGQNLLSKFILDASRAVLAKSQPKPAATPLITPAQEAKKPQPDTTERTER